MKPLIYVTIFSLTWAIQTIVDKVALSRWVDPYVFWVQSTIIAIVLFSTYFIYQKEVRSLAIMRRPLLILIGIFWSTLPILFTFFSLETGWVVNFGFLIKTVAAFTVIFSIIFLKEWISKKQLLALVLVFLWMFLLVSKDGSMQFSPYDLFAIWAAISLATSNIITSLVIKDWVHPKVITLVRMIYGWFFILVLALILGRDVFEIREIPLLFIRWALEFIILFSLIMTIKEAGANYMSSMSSMYSVFVLIFWIVLLWEEVVTLQLLGWWIIIIGTLLYWWNKPKSI